MNRGERRLWPTLDRVVIGVRRVDHGLGRNCLPVHLGHPPLTGVAQIPNAALPEQHRARAFRRPRQPTAIGQRLDRARPRIKQRPVKATGAKPAFGVLGVQHLKRRTNCVALTEAVLQIFQAVFGMGDMKRALTDGVALNALFSDQFENQVGANTQCINQTMPNGVPKTVDDVVRRQPKACVH